MPQNQQCPHATLNATATRSPDLPRLDLVAHRLHDADGLVSERLTRLHRRLAVEQVEIAPADRGARDAHDRVAGRLELRIGQVRDPDGADSVEDDAAHQPSSGKVVSTWPAMYASSCVPFT